MSKEPIKIAIGVAETGLAWVVTDTNEPIDLRMVAILPEGGVAAAKINLAIDPEFLKQLFRENPETPAVFVA